MKVGVVPTNFVAFEIFTINCSNLLIGKPQNKARTVSGNPRLSDPPYNRGIVRILPIVPPFVYRLYFQSHLFPLFLFHSVSTLVLSLG